MNLLFLVFFEAISRQTAILPGYDFPAEFEQLPERPQNHPEVGPALFTAGTGVMMDAALHHAVTGPPGPR